jgi:hypothetical protein
LVPGLPAGSADHLAADVARIDARQEYVQRCQLGGLARAAERGVGAELRVRLYLARRLDEVDDDLDEILPLAARSAFDGKPSGPVEAWLERNGIEP